MADTDADIHFYFDPVCPFAWMTSRWVETVVRKTGYSVDWWFISLRLVNHHLDYATHFPRGYEHGHTAGLRLLRVAAAVRADDGRDAVGAYYSALGPSIFDIAPGNGERTWLGTTEHAEQVLSAAGLATRHASAVDDTRWDPEIQADTDEALRRTGRDVGTPIISFRPPDGPSFFGPVISRLPAEDDAVALWDSVIHLATFPGFAELKKSLRERPQLRALGVEPGSIGVQEDWEAGRRPDTM